MYHIAAEAEFNNWHNYVKQQEDIPLDGSGKKSMIEGVISDYAPRTFAYTIAYQHPDNSDRWVFLYGDYPDAGIYLADTTQYNYEEIIGEGFLLDGTVNKIAPSIIVYVQEDGPLVEE